MADNFLVVRDSAGKVSVFETGESRGGRALVECIAVLLGCGAAAAVGLFLVGDAFAIGLLALGMVVTVGLLLRAADWYRRAWLAAIGDHAHERDQWKQVVAALKQEREGGDL